MEEDEKGSERNSQNKFCLKNTVMKINICNLRKNKKGIEVVIK